ncbi:MAG: LPS-assembly lipoprotein [Pseudomonadota bacterium]|nr:LPS-assembly lipoprotein [Pseudomonadota bacterium]
MKKIASDKLQGTRKKPVRAEILVFRTRCVLFSLLLVTCSFLLPSCGYHLRGAYQLPPQMAITVIRADNMNSELVRSLKRSLETSGIHIVQNVTDTNGVVDEKSQATVLRVIREKQGKRVLSVDSKGRVREYELHYAIAIELSGAGNFFVPEQTLELSRDFLFDPEDVLGKSDEEADLLRDMQQDMVRLIMLRLQAVAQKKSSAVQSPQAQ